MRFHATTTLEAFQGLLRVGEWTVESAFLELKQIEGSCSNANKKKQALKMKENTTAYVAFQKKNNPAANPNQQGNVALLIKEDKEMALLAIVP